MMRGLTYPLSIEDGNLTISTNLGLVEEHIISVLETRPRERVMRGGYGFDPKIFSTLEPNAINARIHKAVSKHVPEVEELEVRGRVSTEDEGLYDVLLLYKVQGIPQPPLNLSLNM